MNFKSELTCQLCSMILSDPVSMPCYCVICRKHILERNEIKCFSCNLTHQITHDSIRTCKTSKNFIELEVFLSDEEKSFKNSIQHEFNKFKSTLNDLKLNKQNECKNHFEKIKVKIEAHKERVKKSIDDISTKCIQILGKKQNSMQKEINENFEQRNLEENFQNILEEFRRLTLNFDKINALKSKQKSIFLNLEKQFDKPLFNTFKDVDFISNDINLIENSFGNLRPSDFFQSKILTSSQTNKLIELCEFNPNDQWSMIYQASRDGFGAKNFHSKCDGQEKTLTILKAKDSANIFGGFADVAWESSSSFDGLAHFKFDSNAFIYSLTNMENQPIKMKTNDPVYSIFCSSEFGPSFGVGDMTISNNANVKDNDNLANLGTNYKHPQYDFESKEAQSFLAGSFRFQLSEIEVYKKF